MSQPQNDSDLEILIDSIDIVDYIGQFVDLKQRGDEFWGLSCFKDEKTPSFSVRRSPPCFYDYSSGIGGNVFTFVRFYFHLKPAEAVQKLKEYAGFSSSGEKTAHIAPRFASTDVYRRFKAPKTTQKQSSGTHLPDNCMLRYENRPEKLEIWRKEGISQAVLDEFQVKYDPFSDRIVYPIRNLEGKIVNVGGRTLDPLFKEHGQKKYCYFYSWGTLDVLYGLFENLEAVKKAREIILFEGCKSVLIARTWNIPNAAAILTSHLNPHQMKILASLGCRAVFALDNDVDIRKDHNIQKLVHYIPVSYIHDTDGLLAPKDAPVDKGKEVFSSLYAHKLRLSNTP